MSPTVPENEDRIDKAILGFTKFAVAVGEPHYSPLLHLLEETHNRIHSITALDDTKEIPDDIDTNTQLKTSLMITSFVSEEFERIGIRERESVKRVLVSIAQESQSAAETLRTRAPQTSPSSTSRNTASITLSVEEIRRVIEENLKEMLLAIPMGPRPGSVIEHSVVESGIEETPRTEELPVQ
jgi:rRNA-processing protein FCF1